MATAQEIMKGRKKEELAEEIIRLQTALEQSDYGAMQMMQHKDKEIAELKSRIETRQDEYQRWKEHNGSFLSRFIGEYMELHKNNIADAVADKIVSGLELTDESFGDYYSHGTDVILSYKGRQLGSASVYQNN